MSSPSEPLSNFSLFLGTAPIAKIPKSMFFKISTSLTQPFIITPDQLFFAAASAIKSPSSATLKLACPSTINTFLFPGSFNIFFIYELSSGQIAVTICPEKKLIAPKLLN